MVQQIPEGILIAVAGDVNVLVISAYGQKILALSSELILHHPFRRLLEQIDFFRPGGTTLTLYEEHPLIRALERGDRAEDDEMALRNAADQTLTVISKYGPIRSESGEPVGGIFSWMNWRAQKDGAGAGRCQPPAGKQQPGGQIFFLFRRCARLLASAISSIKSTTKA